jgi:hypothetical protein
MALDARFFPVVREGTCASPRLGKLPWQLFITLTFDPKKVFPVQAVPRIYSGLLG